MSEYADYTWGVTELQLVSVAQEVEAEQEVGVGVAMETKPCHNCSFDISVCGNLTDEYKMVIIIIIFVKLVETDRTRSRESFKSYLNVLNWKTKVTFHFLPPWLGTFSHLITHTGNTRSGCGTERRNVDWVDTTDKSNDFPPFLV